MVYCTVHPFSHFTHWVPTCSFELHREINEGEVFFPALSWHNWENKLIRSCDIRANLRTPRLLHLLPATFTIFGNSAHKCLGLRRITYGFLSPLRFKPRTSWFLSHFIDHWYNHSMNILDCYFVLLIVFPTVHCIDLLCALEFLSYLGMVMYYYCVQFSVFVSCTLPSHWVSSNYDRFPQYE